MKIIFFFSTLLLSSVFASDVGFYSPLDNKIPTEIQQASTSVLEIRTAFIQDFQSFSDLVIVDITKPSDRNDVYTKIDSIGSPYDEKDKKIMKAFVKRCERRNQLKKCFFPTGLNSGSAFVLGREGTLWTNAHVIEKMLNTKAQTEGTELTSLFTEESSMPIFLFNKEGELIFDGLQEEISFSVLPDNTLLNRYSDSFYSIDSDYVGINLSKKVAEPLVLSKTSPSPGDQIYVIGYPICTNCGFVQGNDDFDRGNQLNAKHCELQITQGEILDKDTWGDLANVNNALVNAINSNSFLPSTADSNYGMSGGPILNSSGGVIGIHVGGKTIVEDDYYSRFSRGVIPKDFK